MTFVTLKNGPFDGRTVKVDSLRETLNVSGAPLPDGKVARYRQSRTPGEFTYRGPATILATLPEPMRR